MSILYFIVIIKRKVKLASIGLFMFVIQAAYSNDEEEVRLVNRCMTTLTVGGCLLGIAPFLYFIIMWINFLSSL